MKSGTESKSKFRQLKRRLQLRYWQVVGVLETLWRVTQADAPAGDIGRLDNDEIAAALEWEGDPDALIDALVDTHWIDRDDEFRLIIHDWSEHAPNHLVGAFKKHGKMFADQIAKQRHIAASGDAKHVAKQSARQSAKHPAIAPCPGTMPEHHATKPSQTKPIQTKPSHPQTPAENPGGAVASGLAGGGDVWCQDSLASCRLALQSCGYKRFNDLLSECQGGGVLPKEVIAVCDEYKANESRFTSPGAIAERLRSGVWPAEGVVSPEEAAKHKSSAANKDVKKTADACRLRLIKAGVNDARDWDDRRVIQECKQRKVMA